ncbi:Reverse transcriptase domain [Trinorchestia longiramus]|nr:Reverse transcriptase domain [Trinorchestia longiramus]
MAKSQWKTSPSRSLNKRIRFAQPRQTVTQQQRWWGSLIYVKEKLQPQIKTKRATEKSEILHLNIQPHPGQTMKIVLVYSHPTCTAIEDDEFSDYLDIFLSTPHKTLIMGDFNLPHINWTTRQSQEPGSKLIDLMNTNSLQQHVNEPNKGNNILDLVMTTTDLSINGLEVTDKIGDHQMIDFSLEVQDPNTRPQHKQVLDYKRANFELVKEELGSYNYEVLMNDKNAEECYMILKDKIASATDHLIPIKRIRPTNNPPWFSQEIKRLINASQHSYRRLKRYQTEPHRQERRTQRVVIHDEASDPALVTSGVPQGSVLDPLLFIIYINDLDVGIISKINKFGDDTKFCHRAFTEMDRATIQSDLNRLLQSTETWQMSFNIEKCSVMHVGANNRHFQHMMYNIPIETAQQQRDLGVIVTENLKHDKQVEKSVKNACRILGFIARNFEYKSKNLILPLYKALVRPHLEYSVQLWSPTL